jgi:hypothetical protein
MADGAERGGRERALALLVAAAALLPFARGLLAGHSFFFRDLSTYFFPLRRFLLQGVLEGQLVYWNPFAHEGAPLTLTPLGYLPDLLQLLRPSEAGLSLVLALHFPLAALGAFALGRSLGMGGAGALAAGLVYALGGFALSTVNLYVYAQALGWAPFVILGLVRAARGTRRDAALGALAIAVALSTTGLEVVAQAIGAGLLLAVRRERGALVRLTLALVLGGSLAAAATFPVGALVADSARGRGFAPEVVVAHSVHPITLAQTLVAGLYADPSRFTDSFWGQNYFPRGFPYFLSLYLGVLVLGLALLGALLGSRPARLLAALFALGLVVSLGRYAGLESVVEAAPWLRRFRFPSKAFYSVHLASALLAGLGLDALVRRGALAWRRAGFVLLALGALVAAAPWLALQQPGVRRFLTLGFFPPELRVAARETALSAIAADACQGALFALVGGALALLASRGLVAPGRAAAGLLLLLGADLVRAGAGLNPMVSPAFFARSPESRAIADSVRTSGGRLFAFDASYSPAYFVARRRLVDHEAWSFAVFQETFLPNFNLEQRVPTALSLDLTMLVPEARVLAPDDASPNALPRLLDRLRQAAVSHVLSLEPLAHPELSPELVSSAARIAPLRAFLYRLREPTPRFEALGHGEVQLEAEAPGRLLLRVEGEHPGRLLVRDAWSPGWRATVDGAPAEVMNLAGHRVVPFPAGRHTIDLRYHPPGLRSGLAVSLLSAIALLWIGGRRVERKAGAATPV